MAIQPVEFISKWKAVELTERAAAHSHFIDLCHLLDEPAPTDADPDGSWYCFERGATKTTEDALVRLLELNQVRTAAQKLPVKKVKRTGPQGTLLLPIAGADWPTADASAVEKSSKRRERSRRRAS